MEVKTFDLDWERLPNGFIVSSDDLLGRVLEKVGKCDKVYDVKRRVSSSGNGYHVLVSCGSGGGCDICRMVFDSPKRLELDVNDPPWCQNVLWDRKTYVKGDHRMVGVAGEWF